MLRPQDVMVLLELTTGELGDAWQQQHVARALGLSAAEVHKALARAAKAGLYRPERRQVAKSALLEFVLHGLRYVYPAHLGGPTRGVPTAWAAPALAREIASDESDRPVWPHAEGSARGPAVEPLYPSAPDAALTDAKLYELLALVDAIRLGRARERKLAADKLTAWLSP